MRMAWNESARGNAWRTLQNRRKADVGNRRIIGSTVYTMEERR